VIGCHDAAVAVRVSELYRGINAPILVTDAASAEMIKYASNAFLATKISFINAIANLCEAVNADVREVALGMGYDARIGFEFLDPGPGYGGSCFPKDTAALLHTADTAEYDFSLLAGVVEVNRRQHERVVAKIRDAVGGSLDGASVALWGLTFKANTDDLRDSPAMAVASRLLGEGARLRAHDPVAGEAAAALVPALEIVADAYDACAGAQVLAVLTEWDEYRWLDFDRVAQAMERPAVVDARNLLDPVAMRRRGFEYQGVGR
jgi:UDPglucose 6-dehydrogenase